MNFKMGDAMIKSGKRCSPKEEHLLLMIVQTDYIKNPSKIPAATAEPITPATFGPMACINR